MNKTENNVTIVMNPLVQHHLTFMRDRETSNGRFREHLKKVTRALFYEAMATLKVPVSEGKYVTPTGNEGFSNYIDSRQFALIAIMRTGVAMSGAVHDSLEEAHIGHAYYERKPDSDEYEELAVRLPELDGRFVFIFDSGMLSGGTVIELLDELVMKRGVDPINVAVLTTVATHRSIQAIQDAFGAQENPIRIFAAAVDDWSEGDDFASPGMGSMRERLFGKVGERKGENL